MGLYSSYFTEEDEQTYLEHHGILGMKWGVRRYQNADGSLTAKGLQRQRKRERKFTPLVVDKNGAGGTATKQQIKEARKAFKNGTEDSVTDPKVKEIIAEHDKLLEQMAAQREEYERKSSTAASDDYIKTASKGSSEKTVSVLQQKSKEWNFSEADIDDMIADYGSPEEVVKFIKEIELLIK